MIVLFIGIFFVALGILMPRYKLYWLIAGLNGRPKKDLKTLNLRYIEKYFGLFMTVLGALNIINVILWTVLDTPEKINSTFLISLFTIIALMVVFGIVNRRKIGC